MQNVKVLHLPSTGLHLMDTSPLTHTEITSRARARHEGAS